MNLILYPSLTREPTELSPPPGLPNVAQPPRTQVDKALFVHRLLTDVIETEGVAHPAICFSLHLHFPKTDRN
jgi:hypothetical protein